MIDKTICVIVPLEAVVTNKIQLLAGTTLLPNDDMCCPVVVFVIAVGEDKICVPATEISEL